MAESATPPGAEDEFSFAPVPTFTRPLADEGPHNCTSAMAVFEKRAPYTKVDSKGNPNPLVPTVTIYCVSDQEYEGFEGTPEKHMFFYSMPLSAKEDSKMGEFFKGVMGAPPPVDANGELDFRPVMTDQDREGAPRHRLPRLEGMQFTIVNKITTTKMGPNAGKKKNKIDSIFTSKEQKAANAANFRRESPTINSAKAEA